MLFLLRHDDFRQGQDFVEFAVGGGLELAVVDFYAVVQVQGGAGEGEVGQLFVLVVALLELLAQHQYFTME